jgi:hypothetical protein
MPTHPMLAPPQAQGLRSTSAFESLTLSSMARRIDWDKVRRQEKVYENGSLSVEADGWNESEEPPKRSQHQSKAVPTKDQEIGPIPPGKWKLIVRINGLKHCTMSYSFEDTCRKHRKTLIPLVKELLDSHPSKNFVSEFSRFLQQSYEIKATGVSETATSAEFDYCLTPH